ncbi:MAG: GAF domain-containing protein, partial [Spirochaetota bacterium]
MEIETHDKQHYRRKINELQLLFEISRTLDESLDLQDVVEPVLRLTTELMGMLRSTITLLNRKTGEIGIESAYGLSDSQQKRGKYFLGEGVTGKVVQTGQPVIIPNVSVDPEFLNKTGARGDSHKKDISFICVPIKLGKE